MDDHDDIALYICPFLTLQQIKINKEAFIYRVFIRPKEVVFGQNFKIFPKCCFVGRGGLKKFSTNSYLVVPYFQVLIACMHNKPRRNGGQFKLTSHLSLNNLPFRRVLTYNTPVNCTTIYLLPCL